MNPTTELFSYHKLGANPNDMQDIRAFTSVRPEGNQLIRYLQNDAFKDEQLGLMCTYLVYDNMANMLASYFSLKAGLVSTNERHIMGVRGFDTVPGVELANFAVNGEYRRRYASSRGCGKAIFFGPIMDVAKSASEHIGVRMLYIYSLPYRKVIKNYESYGFRRLPDIREERRLHRRLRPRYDNACIFMSMPNQNPISRKEPYPS